MPNLIVSKWRKSNPVRISPIRCLLLLLIYSPVLLANSPLQNHPSPYIRLHADDAVQWRLWNESVMRQAQEENKLILVSIGYYACHWCHVMRDESFNDAVVAGLLNAHFIPVKIDREFNPALDNYLMDFLQQTRGYGGWPLNVFITPDGYPLLGMVYLPRADFIGVLRSLHDEWQSDAASLNRLALNAFEFSRQLNAGMPDVPDAKELDYRFMQMLISMADELQGGLGQQARFPQPALLLVLLQRYQQQLDNDWLREYLQLTLKQIASRGLHDVVGGGFFRYTVDPDWQTPHFEKMLYVNAGLIQVYVRAYKIFGNAEYLQLASETARFLLRDMQLDSGGFISSLSAQDSHGVEGGSYVWSRQELESMLSSAQWQQVNSGWQLNQLQESQLLLPVGMAFEKRWDEIKRRLLSKRHANPPPRDEKFLLSWNGYTLTALAMLYAIMPDAQIRQAGDRLYDVLLAHARTGLVRVTATGSRRYLEDYAFVAQGLRDWGQVRHKPGLEQIVKRLIQQARQLFWLRDGWRLSDEQILPLPGNRRVIADGDLPSPAVVVQSLALVLQLQPPGTVTQVDRLFLADPLGYASSVEFFSQQAGK